MLSYLKKRFIYNCFSLYIIITITFFLGKALPGDPFQNEEGNLLSQETVTCLKEYYGLNKSLIYQYFDYMKSLLKLDLGQSIIYKDRSVYDILCKGFIPSAIIGLEASILSIGGGVLIGTYAALSKRNRNTLIKLMSIILVSMPVGVATILVQYILAIKIPIFPIACWGKFHHTILPALALAIGPLGFVAQLTQNSVTKTLNKDFVLIALSKGIKSKIILIKHIMPTALFPVLSYSSFLISTVMTGAPIVEQIFGVPGLGKWYSIGLNNRDYPVMLGVNLFYGLFFITICMILDIIQAWLNPSLKHYYLHKHDG